MKKIFLLFLIVFAVENILPQNPDPKTILNKVKEKFLTVKDYTVDVRIKVDVDFLRVPVTEAQILFKQPNKTRIKSEGFALLPKAGLNFSPTQILEGEFTSFFDSEQKIGDNSVYVIKIIPLGNDGEIVLSTLWIDKNLFLLRKIETATKLNGVFTLELEYDPKITKHPLPASMLFSFDISKISFPKSVTGEVSDESNKRRKKNKLTKGTVTINYSNYKVNKGIADFEFEAK